MAQADSKRPWFKFYPSDWRADKGLRLCGAAARGLWIEMLCVMHEAKPYGHLLVNGHPLTDTQLASLSGIPLDQVLALLAELENVAVFSRNGKGVIYSRRMTRDARKAAKCSHAGAKGGGNPTLNDTTFKGDGKGQNDLTFDLEARDHKQDIPKKEDLKKVVLTSIRPGGQQWTPAQKKAAWQGKICVEAERTMTADQYASFLALWTADDPKTLRLVEDINANLRRAQRRKTA